MSDLNPAGVKVQFDGKARHFLFTLNAIDEIQSHYDMTMFEALGKLFDKKEQITSLRYFVFVLVNDEVERNKWKNPDYPLERITEKEAGWMVSTENIGEITAAILEAYHVSVPEPDEESDPNRMGGRQNS